MTEQKQLVPNLRVRNLERPATDRRESEGEDYQMIGICWLLLLHRVRKKRGHVIFNYNSRIPWSIFIIFIPLETGMNTPQLPVIYLLKIFMMS